MKEVFEINRGRPMKSVPRFAQVGSVAEQFSPPQTAAVPIKKEAPPAATDYRFAGYQGILRCFLRRRKKPIGLTPLRRRLIIPDRSTNGMKKSRQSACPTSQKKSSVHKD